MESKYTNLREVTPQEMMCLIGSCPSAYETTREGKEVYLIIGKQINPLDVGLEKKVGDGEALVEIPRALIDDREK
ncbi:MAG: hypothetical protein U9Q06_01030 [Nanoarchaeota archaeon]|nr:hypothetical protein [Nanoarchaeota archaeon]